MARLCGHVFMAALYRFLIQRQLWIIFLSLENTKLYVTLNEVKGLPRHARGILRSFGAQNDRKFSYPLFMLIQRQAYDPQLSNLHVHG